MACAAGIYYADGVKSAALRAFGEWLLTAVVAFVILEIARQVLPGHRMTLLVVGLSIGAATAEKAVVRFVRSRRAGG
jgi:hypothetical protein